MSEGGGPRRPAKVGANEQWRGDAAVVCAHHSLRLDTSAIMDLIGAGGIDALALLDSTSRSSA